MEKNQINNFILFTDFNLINNIIKQNKIYDKVNIINKYNKINFIKKNLIYLLIKVSHWKIILINH